MAGRNKGASTTSQAVPVSQAPTQAIAGPSRTLLQSSLDIVWSYSRSHAFVGSNLPSSPSFVTRYRRPSWAEDGVSVISRRPSQYSVETGDDADEEEDEEEEEESSQERRRSSNIESERSLSWELDAPGRPIQKQTSRVRFVSPAGPATERTRLLTPVSQVEAGDARAQLRQSLLSASPPEGVPFARRASPKAVERLSESPISMVEEDLDDVLMLSGQSTFSQTLFNTVNALVGIGLLAVPLAFAQAGWVIGPMVLLFCCIVTNYTSKVLVRILAQDATLSNYSDIGAKAFGPLARVFISLLFCLELSAASVALCILFSDSVAELFNLPVWVCKLGFFVVLPTVFLPLRFVSYASLIGIVSSFTLVIVLVVDGSIKESAPGSLRDPMPTSVVPSAVLPLCFGLFASGFGGHAVIPSIARDMKKPQRFNKMIDVAYIITTAIYFVAGIFGYLMFGQTVSDEISRDLYNTPGFPRSLALIAVAMIAINPLAKFALTTSPLHDTIEYALGIDARMSIVLAPSDGPQAAPPGMGKLEASSVVQSASSVSSETAYAGSSGISLLSATPMRATFSHILVKVLSTALLIGIAIVLPGFDRVMGFLGAFAVFMISVIGPLAAHLKINGPSMSTFEKLLDAVVLMIAVGMSVTGTIWAFLPSSSGPLDALQ